MSDISDKSASLNRKIKENKKKVIVSDNSNSRNVSLSTDQLLEGSTFKKEGGSRSYHNKAAQAKKKIA